MCRLCSQNRNHLTMLNLQFVDYMYMNLPNSLQRRALDELKMCVTSSSKFGKFFKLPQKAAIDLAQCHLLPFGTDYNPAEALHWLKVSKSSGISPFCLHGISEALGLAPGTSERPENQLEVCPERPKVECLAGSELYLIKKIQSRAVSAVNHIRASSPDCQSCLRISYTGLRAVGILGSKIAIEFWSSDITTWEIAALLGEDEILFNLPPPPEVFNDRNDRINALDYACIGGNLSTLQRLLDYGVDPSLHGIKNITALHLLIYMPAEFVERAVNLLVAHGAPTDACSKKISLKKMGFDLSGTPIEWAVLARNRALVAALLPHSIGQERRVLRCAISHAFYEIANDLLSKSNLCDPFTDQDCPIFICTPSWAHLIAHGRDGDLAIERTIRLFNEHNLINYETKLREGIVCVKTP